MVKLCRQSPGSVGAPPEKLTNRPARRAAFSALASHSHATKLPPAILAARTGCGGCEGGGGRARGGEAVSHGLTSHESALIKRAAAPASAWGTAQRWQPPPQPLPHPCPPSGTWLERNAPLVAPRPPPGRAGGALARDAQKRPLRAAAPGNASNGAALKSRQPLGSLAGWIRGPPGP